MYGCCLLRVLLCIQRCDSLSSTCQGCCSSTGGSPYRQCCIRSWRNRLQGTMRYWFYMQLASELRATFNLFTLSHLATLLPLPWIVISQLRACLTINFTIYLHVSVLVGPAESSRNCVSSVHTHRPQALIHRRLCAALMIYQRGAAVCNWQRNELLTMNLPFLCACCFTVV